MRRLLVFAVMLALPAADWPRFRGPNGAGVASDTNIPIRFSATEGILWQTAIPGSGNSSPCVVSGKVFLQTASTDGKERFLVCVDAATGKILWSKGLPGDKARHHNKNSLASSTPTADTERVYALFWNGADLTLTAYTFDGSLVWKTPLGPFQARHGAGTSPIVASDKVLVANDQEGQATLMAFDAKTGKPAWQVPRKQGKESSYSTPLLREGKNGPELVVGSTTGLAGYDPKTGAEQWNWEWVYKAGPLRMVASPVAGAGLVFATTGNGAGNSHAVAVQPGTDGKPGELVWEKTKAWPYVTMLLEQNGYLYFASDKGIAGCFEAKTGKEVWTERLGADGFTSSPVLIDGKVFAVSEKGNVYVFAASPAGYQLLARNALGEEVFASPAVADGKLFIRGKTHLFCIGKK